MGNSDLTTHKFVVVLNKKYEVPRLMNALGHVTLALVERASDAVRKDMAVVDYIDADGNVFPLSNNSFVILKADNANKLRTLLLSARQAEGLEVKVFTHTTYKGTFVEQLVDTKNTKEADMDYIAVAVFGEISKVSELTRKFSLYT